MDPSPARRFLCAAASLAIAGYVATVAATFVPRHPFALGEHFRLQIALAGLAVAAAAGVLALRARWLDARWFDAALIALLVEACVIAPDLASARRPVPEGAQVRVLLLNVLRSATGYAEVRRLIAEERPDLVALVETDEDWLRELAPALAAYPARIEAPRTDNFGLALYAREPLAGGVEYLGLTTPSIVAATTVGGARLELALVHPTPPMTGAMLAQQLHHFDEIAARTAAFTAPFLVLGDFNAAPWTRAFARLIGGTGTCDTRAGFGAQTSYIGGGWLFRIPIDHVLASCSIGVRDRRVGPDVGSDHLPVIVDLVVPR